MNKIINSLIIFILPNVLFASEENSIYNSTTFAVMVYVFIFGLFVLSIRNIILRNEVKKREFLEKKLIENEKELKLIFDNAQIGLLFETKDRKIKKVNQKFLEIFGMENESNLIGQGVDRFHVSKESYEKFGKKYINNLKDENKLNIEYQVKRKDGTLIWCELSGRLFNEGILWVMNDISKRKELQEQLKESEIKYKTLFKSNRAIELIIDPNTSKIVDCNDKAQKYYGCTYEELTSMGIYDINTLSKEEIKKEMALAKSEQRDFFNFKHKLCNGQIRDVEVFSGPLKVEGKDYLYSIIFDVTKQKQQEKMLYHQAKVAAVGEMLSNIAHQWRQPLTIITTDVSSLEIDLELKDEIPKERILKTINNVLNQSLYLSKTLDDFRHFFDGDTKIRENIDIKLIIERLNSITNDLFKKDSVQIVSNLESSIISINENLIIQAMLNIYNNAKDAIVLNNNDLESRYFFIDLKNEKDKTVLRFKDTGYGIDEKILDKIFEPYFTTKHKSVGTGIGLYMTNQIITKQLGGDISIKNIEYEFDNKKLKGAEFTIVFNQMQ